MAKSELTAWPLLAWFLAGTGLILMAEIGMIYFTTYNLCSFISELDESMQKYIEKGAVIRNEHF